MSFIAAQICSIVGMGMLFASFQAKTTLRICLMQCVACVFLTTQFVLLGAFTGAVLNGLSLARNVVYANADKPWGQHRLWPFVFSAMYITAGIIVWQDIFSLMPMVALVLATFALREENAQKARLLNLPTSPLWMMYDAHAGAYLSAATEAVVLVGIIIGLIRFRKIDKN